MSRKLLLVDFENVHKVDISLLDERAASTLSTLVFKTLMSAAATLSMALPALASTVVIPAICAEPLRLTLVDVMIDGAIAQIKVGCVRDGQGPLKFFERRQNLKFSLLHAELKSIHALEPIGSLGFTTKIDAAGHTVVVRRADGSICLSVKASRLSARPVPRRFVGSNGDWASSIDYHVDKECRALVVQLGNSLALLSVGQPEIFSLYRVRFRVSTSMPIKKE